MRSKLLVGRSGGSIVSCKSAEKAIAKRFATLTLRAMVSRASLPLSVLLIIPPFVGLKYRVGRMIRTGGAFRRFSLLSSQNDSFTEGETTFSTTTTVVPVANNTAAPATTMAFAFVHAISFNAPLMRVQVEPPSAALTLLRIHRRTLY